MTDPAKPTNAEPALVSAPKPLPTLLPTAPMSGTRFSLVPQNFEEAWRFAKMIAGSTLAPKDYRNQPENVVVAVQMGAEIGLLPMQAVQNIAVINGKPSIYGDLGKALLRANGFDIDEDDTAVVEAKGRGRCLITHPRQKPVERTFSTSNAKTAGLLGKQGPWTNYPFRQMAWRAFWFAARDAAPDILRGIGGAEESMDLPPPPAPSTTDRRERVAAPELNPPALLPAPAPEPPAGPPPAGAEPVEDPPPAGGAPDPAPEAPGAASAPPPPAAAQKPAAGKKPPSKPPAGRGPDDLMTAVNGLSSAAGGIGLRVEIEKSGLPADITGKLLKALDMKEADLNYKPAGDAS